MHTVAEVKDRSHGLLTYLVGVARTLCNGIVYVDWINVFCERTVRQRFAQFDRWFVQVRESYLRESSGKRSIAQCYRQIGRLRSNPSSRCAIVGCVYHTV